ncbi:TPA: hypothetical protein CPT79_07310 [Candidatus Gastranaerophilales bacterium HUM_6]|jgi:hypothetical protein|nr:hypothetical protein [bacterium]DAA89659.1 MAG TPA: hypothetical protein CPT79_07310 [Candidatus Gastranaerophilales bacterium HUM_6]DAA92430.1 MAG TPA: hypothetical protein CPT93_06520 [Candidatus Gastranaerophilales bacterium HUM_7]DAB02093.1 MAG TPA: hypothetical protein CPT84_05945 [Candidatus Gastranaerophilales bacterium HUM_12]DAB06076.1 MAG TPA: hypothetical protein CPT78_05870 [Candidatus Gastranaerophilales bacterium HUM_14]
MMLGSNILAYAEEPLKGSVTENDNYQKKEDDLFTGKIESLERKDIINMTVSQVLDSSISVEGDEFFAEVTSDVYGDKGVIIPKGTVAHGRLDSTTEPKRLGKEASLTLSFDYLVTPDGREIPIEGKMTTKLHPIAAGAKIAAQDLGYTVVGGAVGGLAALNWLGLEAAIASQGYTLAGGAAIGGVAGLGMALIRKGNHVLIAPGDEIKVKINTKVDLPVYKEEALKQEEVLYDGLTININEIKHEKDPFGEANTITLTVLISNMSDKTLSGFDMALVNDYNAKFSPSIFGDTKLMFRQIKPGDKLIANVSFAVDNINRKFWLTFYDRKTNEVITKISLDNAYRTMPEKVKKKNEKLRTTKKNFKKEEDFMDMNF